jgi:hypothetical protein
MANTPSMFAVRITVRLSMKFAKKWYLHSVCTISLILINVKRIAILLIPKGCPSASQRRPGEAAIASDR